MKDILKYSVFYEILFPEKVKDNLISTEETETSFTFRKDIIYKIQDDYMINSPHTKIVVFDLETTGLDINEDKIIEIGAQKLCGFDVIDEYATLINPFKDLSSFVTDLTGIKADMLKDKPHISEVLKFFLKFIDGSILVAHNADFDMSFINTAFQAIGYNLQWPCLCTLKLSKVFLPELESKNLDEIAKHFNLKFEARHRALGDVKVTAEIWKILLQSKASHLKTWRDFKPFMV